ncbi:MAG: hypothetical protein RXR52_02575, partial [Paraburkholderia sp.]|uniref:hypothetical protein n=1 Tax=Paraburkholderia sp. TaxID=1926495 RepID=UPI00397B90A0
DATPCFNAIWKPVVSKYPENIPRLTAIRQTDLHVAITQHALKKQFSRVCQIASQPCCIWEFITSTY